MKTLRFIGSSIDDLRDFPMEARREAGFELDAVQRGLMPLDFKPMLSVGAGAYEIRLHVPGEWRVIYVAKFDNAVYVLHAFHHAEDPQGRHRRRRLDVIDRLEVES
jgi:phage-related protein